MGRDEPRRSYDGWRYDLSGVPQGPGLVFVLKEFAVNNAWQVDTAASICRMSQTCTRIATSDVSFLTKMTVELYKTSQNTKSNFLSKIGQPKLSHLYNAHLITKTCYCKRSS
jgi:hypothetical protein